jgi:hypothetical protein
MSILDVVTLAIILFVVATLVAFALWLAGLPGKIARARGHAQADAVNVAGWLSLLTFFTTWPFVLVWAYFRPISVRVAGDSEAQPSRKEAAR